MINLLTVQNKTKCQFQLSDDAPHTKIKCFLSLGSLGPCLRLTRRNMPQLQAQVCTSACFLSLGLIKSILEWGRNQQISKMLIWRESAATFFDNDSCCICYIFFTQSQKHTRCWFGTCAKYPLATLPARSVLLSNAASTNKPINTNICRHSLWRPPCSHVCDIVSNAGAVQQQQQRQSSSLPHQTCTELL